MELMIEDLMEEVIERGGSDLHLSAGLPPYIRISGRLTPTDHEPMSPESCQRLIFSMLNNTQRKHLEQNWELDCSYGVKGLARFRVNVYKDRGTYAACLRALSSHIPTMEVLGLPNIVRELSEKPRGLILVTGPTGSGKSTTLASMINNINLTRSEHILTVEDPIEFIYEPVKSLIHQRQIGEDSKSFANALRAALREDPDVILVGEMRDLETIALAISAAETGHLVLATLHTNDAVSAVTRLIDMGVEPFLLSSSLLGVGAQRLVRRLCTQCRQPDPVSKGWRAVGCVACNRTGYSGRTGIYELLQVDEPIRAMIHRNASEGEIRASAQKSGMQTMRDDGLRWVRDGTTSFDEVVRVTRD